MGVIEAIKKGFGTANKNLGLVLVLFVFNALWAIGSLPFMAAANASAPVTAAAMVFSIVFILVSVFIQGGTLGLVRDHLKTGSMKLAGFIPHGFKYYLRLFILGLVIVLIVGIVAVIATVIIAATAPLNKVAVTIAATGLAVAIGLVGLYFVVLLIMSPYSMVCDDTGVVAAMKNSMKFVKAKLVKTILLLVLLILISLGVGFLVGFGTGLATIAVSPRIGHVVIGLVNSIFNGYLGVAMIASFMSFYLGLSGKEA